MVKLVIPGTIICYDKTLAIILISRGKSLMVSDGSLNSVSVLAYEVRRRMHSRVLFVIVCVAVKRSIL